MALLVAGKCGGANTSVLKEQYVQTWFDTLEWLSVATNQEVNYLDNIYSVMGHDYYDELENATADSYVDVMSFKSGKKIRLKVTRTLDLSPYYFIEISVYMTDADNSNEQVLVNGHSFISRYKVGGIWYKSAPFLISVIYDKELASAVLCVCCAVNYSQYSGFYYGMSTCRTKFSPNALYEIIKDDVKEYDSDPWSDAGYSDIGGGDGSFDFSSDNVGLPELPTIGTLDTGFLQLYKGNSVEIRNLAGYMWTTDFFDNVVKLTQDPMDIIMALKMFPFSVPATQRATVQAGNVNTNIEMSIPDNEIIEIDCGSMEIQPFFGSYMDYSPFSKCELFLPYCGIQAIAIDDIMGKTVSIKYRVDILTGACCAYITVNGNLLYAFSGDCGASIPVTSKSYEGLYNAIVSVGSTVLGAGLTSVQSIGSFASGVMQSKPSYDRSGNISSNNGFMGVQSPYFIFTLPNVAIPKGQNKYIGYPIFATYELKNLSGYTEIEEIHLEQIDGATDNEYSEIVSLLKGGVIL